MQNHLQISIEIDNLINMKYIQTFEDFIITESASGKRVCIFPGRFQPFHLGHIAALQRASNEFGVPVIPIQILSKSDKSPFPDHLLEKMGKAVAKEFSFIENYYLYPSNLKTVTPVELSPF